MPEPNTSWNSLPKPSCRYVNEEPKHSSAKWLNMSIYITLYSATVLKTQIQTEEKERGGE